MMVNGCLGCSGLGDLMLSTNMTATYEGRELVVYQQVSGRNEEVVRIKCDYCTHCGRKLECIRELSG